MTLLDLPQVPLMLSHHQSAQTEVLSVTGYIDAFTVPTLQMLLRVREKITDQGRTLVSRLRPGSQPETVFRGSKLASLLNAAYEPAA